MKLQFSYDEEQIVRALRQAEAGQKLSEICRQMGVVCSQSKVCEVVRSMILPRERARAEDIVRGVLKLICDRYHWRNYRRFRGLLSHSPGPLFVGARLTPAGRGGEGKT